MNGHAKAPPITILVVDDEAQMRRRQLVHVTAERHLYAYTPEDILLQKPRWFRKGSAVARAEAAVDRS